MTTNKKRLLAGPILLLIALACNDHGLLPVENAIEVEIQDNITELETNEIDILWVIDNSHSMCQEQVSLVDNFDLFLDGLLSTGADFHMAVVNTDTSHDAGAFVHEHGDVPEECAGDIDLTSCVRREDPVLRASDYREDPDDETSAIDAESLKADFRCIAVTGAVTTPLAGFEKGLDAMQRALSDDMLSSVNNGFRRESAWLAIIVISDENDCSDNNSLNLVEGNSCEWQRDQLVPPTSFVDFLNSLEGTDDGNRVLIAGIIGPDNDERPVQPEQPRPSCTSALGDAYAGYRYEEVINAFGDRGVVANICDGSFQAALDQIARVIRENLAVKCLTNQPDTCEDTGDCDEGFTCEDADGAGPSDMQVCSDFELVVESRDADNEWLTLRGPEEANPQYEENWAADSCPSGVGVEFTVGNEPRPGQEFRIRYPFTIGGDDEAGETEGE